MKNKKVDPTCTRMIIKAADEAMATAANLNPCLRVGQLIGGMIALYQSCGLSREERESFTKEVLVHLISLNDQTLENGSDKVIEIVKLISGCK